MTTDNVPMQDPNETPSVTDEVVKPKRTRRTKAAADEAVSAPVTEAPAAEAAASEEAVTAKKAATRRKKVADAAPAEPVPAEVVAEPAQAEPVAEAKPKRAPRKKAAAVAEAGDDAASSGPSAPQAKVAVAVDAPREETPHGFFQLAPETPDAPAAQAAQGGGEGAAGGEQSGEPREGQPGREGGRGNRRDRDRDRTRGPRGERGDRPPRPERQAASQDGGDAPQPEGQEGDEFHDESGEPRTSRRAAMAAEQATEVFAELLSGDFDKQHEEESAEAATEEGGEAAAYKRVLRPEPDAPKLQKVLAQAGVGSRRDIEQMIEDGRIEVNDQVAHIGQRISFGDRIKVAGRSIKVRIQPPAARILAYHKPVGEVVTHDDPQGRPTVFQRLPRLQNGKWMSVGRLDLNTEGLLLFTNSGELANQLMHPRFGVEREYAVRVLGSLDEGARNKLLTGVEIDGQQAGFLSISTSSGEGVNQWYRVVISEGRNREVRKLFDAVGLTVNRLIRVRYGAIVLPRGLRRGVWVELGESDVRAVKSLAGMDRQDFGQQPQQGRGNNKGHQQKGQQHNKGQQQQGFKGKHGGQGGQQGGPQQGQGGRPQHGGGQGGQGGNQGGYGNRPPQQQRNPMQDRPQQAPRHHDGDEDLDHIGPIPNPLEQTFDKRFVKGSKRITSGFGRPDQDHGRDGGHGGGGGGQGGKAKGPRQPDPMQTSVGYIGADAYFGKVGGGNRRGGGGGGGGGGRGRR